ncbi:MAG: hypothetical protein U1F66_00825 [bacterium]
MDIEKKISHLHHFLKLALNSSDVRRACGNLEIAQKVMTEIEVATLEDPNATERHIESVVLLTRSPQWQQAQSHIEVLRNNERLCVSWVERSCEFSARGQILSEKKSVHGKEVRV